MYKLSTKVKGIIEQADWTSSAPEQSHEALRYLNNKRFSILETSIDRELKLAGFEDENGDIDTAYEAAAEICDDIIKRRLHLSNIDFGKHLKFSMI